MRNSVTWILFLLCTLCFSSSVSPVSVSSATAAPGWQKAYHAERKMRRDLLRQQYLARQKQLRCELLATHPADTSQRRAVLECMRNSSRWYHEQLKAMIRDERNLRRAYQFGIQTSPVPAPIVINAAGSPSVVRAVSPVTATPTSRVVPAVGNGAGPRIVAPAQATSRTIAPTVPGQTPMQSVVVPASNLESLPLNVEPLPTPASEGKPTPARRPAK